MMRPEPGEVAAEVWARGRRIGAAARSWDSWYMNSARNRLTPIMMKSRPSGVTFEAERQFMRAVEAPVKASTCAKVARAREESDEKAIT